jgi:hypothetical protein
VNFALRGILEVVRASGRFPERPLRCAVERMRLRAPGLMVQPSSEQEGRGAQRSSAQLKKGGGGMRRIVLLLSSMVSGVLLLASGMVPSTTYGQATTASFTDVSAGGITQLPCKPMERYGNGARVREAPPSPRRE